MQQIDVFDRLAVDSSGKLYLYEGEDRSFEDDLNITFTLHFLRQYSDVKQGHYQSRRTLLARLDSEDRSKVWIVMFLDHEKPSQQILWSRLVRLDGWLAEAGLELISLEQKKYGAYQQADQA